MTFAVFLFKKGKMFDEAGSSTTAQDLSYIHQLRTDWTTLPYVGLYTSSAWSCDEGDDELFTRPWYGSTLGCDCLNVCATDISGTQMQDCDKMVLG